MIQQDSMLQLPLPLFLHQDQWQISFEQPPGGSRRFFSLSEVKSLLIYDRIWEKDRRKIANLMGQIQSPPSLANFQNQRFAFIGRFQPLHLAHLAIIKKLMANRPLGPVLIGLCRKPRRQPRYGFTAKEVRQMINDSLPGHRNYQIIELDIKPTDEEWYEQLDQSLGKVDLFVTGNPYLQRGLEKDCGYQTMHAYDLNGLRYRISGTAIRFLLLKSLQNKRGKKDFVLADKDQRRALARKLGLSIAVLNLLSESDSSKKSKGKTILHWAQPSLLKELGSVNRGVSEATWQEIEQRRENKIYSNQKAI